MRRLSPSPAVWWTALVCALGLLPGFLLRGQSPGSWTKITAPRFDLYSNASPARTGEIARHLAMLEEAYAGRNPAQVDRNPGRVQVLFFADPASYLPYQIASQAPAFFQYGRGRSILVAHDLGPLTFEILSHEYFHLYAHRQNIHLPEWLEEGLAEYYSTLRIENSRAVVGLPQGRLQGGEREVWSVRELFGVTEADTARMSPSAKERFYRRSWLLTHFLQAVDPWREGFGRLLERAQREGSEEALRAVYGDAIARLDEAMRAYVPQPGVSTVWQTERPAVSPSAAGFAPAEVAAWEVPLLQADVLAILGRQDAAAAAYERIARQFPEIPEIYEAQGQLALERYDLKAAQALFEEAVKRSSSSAEVYHRLATLRCGMQSEEAACLDWIDRALTLAGQESGQPVKREALFYAVDFALNVKDFPRALRYLARVQPETNQDRFQAAIKTAYAQYQLEAFEAARATLAQAEALPDTRGQRKEIADLRRAIDQREEFLAQQRLFSESSAEEGSAGQRAEALQKVLAAFSSQPGAVLEAGTLREIVCEGARIFLLADTPSGRIRLDVKNPMDLTVLRGFTRLRELDLVCGPHAQAAQFGYLRRGEGAETRGDLRILQLEPGAATPNAPPR